MKRRVGGLLGAATAVAAIAASFGSTGAVAAEAGTGCNVAGSNNLTFALFDGSQSVPPDQFQAAVNGLEQGYVENLVNAKQIPDLMLGTFGSSARKAMQGLPRLTLQNVRNFERPPCAKRGLGILNYRLVQDWKRVRVDRGSAILEALYGVGGYMRAPTGDKKLMIYSDMLEESAWQKFGPSIATPKARAAALNKLAKSGHIATLKWRHGLHRRVRRRGCRLQAARCGQVILAGILQTSTSDACIYRHRVSNLRRLRDYAQLTWSSRHAHRTNRRRLARRPCPLDHGSGFGREARRVQVQCCGVNI